MKRSRLGIGIICALACLWVGCDEDPPPTPAPKPATAPATTTAPATRPAAQKKPPTDLLGVVLAKDPDFPSTQPLSDAVSLAAAARLIFDEGVYLCPRGDLWLTHPDAPPTQAQLKAAFRQQTHAVPDRVRYVYWRPGSSNMLAEVIAQEADGTDVWITTAHRAPLPAGLTRDFSRALFWTTDQMRALVVPTDRGISVLSLRDGEVIEDHVQLADPGPGVTCSAAFDTRGLLAWSSSATQPSAVARYVDGKWTRLTPGGGWPEKLLHVVPYADGSVMTVADANGSLALGSVLIEAVSIDETRILELVRHLADKLPEVREQAQAELANLGPSAWPTLQRVQSTQPAEARIRIRAILGDQTTPTIAGLKPEPGKGRLVSRLRDGGVILWFEAGVSSVDRNSVVVTTAPAWIVVSPSRFGRLVPDAVTRDLRPDAAPILTWGDEWIVEHDVDGPLRWMGNHLVPLTKSKERMFRRFVGIDAEGRWVLKTIDPNGPTLVIDPTRLDPRPKLPVWTINAGRKKVGWNAEDWPVTDRGGYWILKDGAWAPLRGEHPESLFRTQLDPPSTQQTTPSALLTDAQGNRYENGLTALEVTTQDGRSILWPLPAEATGEGVVDGKPVLIEAAGKLFLFNAPGRAIRLTRQLDKAEPFAMDAIFTRHIPATDIRRIWKDPAGRIVIASEGSVLSIAFPEGMIPNQTSNLIPSGALKRALEEETDESERK